MSSGTAATDVSAPRVERLDDGVGTPATRLRRGPRHQAGPKRAECRHEPDQPRSERSLSYVTGDALPRGAERHIPAQPFEHDLLNDLDAQEEERSDEPCRDADERGSQQSAT